MSGVHAGGRRRRRWPWILLVVVVLLTAAAVAVDRIAARVAEGKGAEALQSSQHLSTRPDVHVHGFPFLTQVLDRQFDDVSVRATDVQVGQGRGLHVDSIDVDLHTVTVSSDYRSVRVANADARARVSDADLSTALGTPITSTADGRVVAHPSVTVLGRRFGGTVSAKVQASSRQGMTFGDPQVTVLGVDVPSVVTKALAAVFEQVISLDGLPFGVTVDGVDVDASGLVLRLSGKDLVYRRS